ncbi:aspartate aminotransferase [Arthrobacter sp. MYb23]|uniref:pyridoxal phosphate-dependent aminotransferase n=1 Tax=unclassified Arthrobacter TaxID=235627 RepID=UPI000CFA8D3B|nr:MULTISPECIES: pyridoxal phosphate-dependent aminotransferase [unclassified Arthrobacter]PRB43044.1 aspartate aminotransferase [Arthrobacter sp. MYb51]PRB97996.1 aspartate aminotransferase [Arthrobacter sp. MYb23]
MQDIRERFINLGIDFAPGQEGSLEDKISALAVGGNIPGAPVDFSHGDVDAFTPSPGAFEAFQRGVQEGGQQAYTEYSGRLSIREVLAQRLTNFTGASIAPSPEMIITPGTQGALFLAMAACVGAGDHVAIVQPDYFANRKLVEFFGGVVRPVRLDYEDKSPAMLNLDQLEEAFHSGVKTFVFSNPNNPTGVVYTAEQIRSIAELANTYDATVIVDQLYSRLRYEGTQYTHLRASGINPDNCLTIMGPSKTESLSGYRLGVAFGSASVISRMEKTQAIVSLRAPGYNQAVLDTYFNEPEGWLDERILGHQAIRDDLVRLFTEAGYATRVPEAGSYLFPRLPDLNVGTEEFVKLARLQTNVTVTPGAEFSPLHGHSIRLNYSQDRNNAVAAVERLIELAKRYTR